MQHMQTKKIIPSQHILLKFVAAKAYAEDLLNGRLYMNSLHYFWNEFQINDSDVRGQKDMFEGVYCHVDPVKFGFPKDFADALVSDAAIRAEGYKYCHVHCYYRLDYWMDNHLLQYDLSDLMNDFGQYVVIIDDEKEFLKRVGLAAAEQNVDFLCGNVHYRAPKKNGEVISLKHHIVLKAKDYLVDVTQPPYAGALTSRRDAFDKMDAMAYQKEWRIAVYDGEKSVDPKVLELKGGISDIAHIVETSRLAEELDSLFPSGKIKPGLDGWYGNIGRREMREKFYDLGDHKGSVFGIIG